jgi:1-deoxy-D-xylulose-5-phosphate synthase
LDRAGLVGADGPTHHGAYDIAYMRCLPNMVVSAPMDEIELRNLMFTATSYKEGAFTIRYPRGEGVFPDWKKSFQNIEVGTSRLIQEGEELAILSFGHPGNFVKEACEKLAKEGIRPAHYDMRFAKPLDEKTLHKIFARFDKVITVEDGCVQGGFGSAILEFMAANEYSAIVKILGIPDEIIEHGEPYQLYAQTGFDSPSIVDAVHSILEKSLNKVS